MQSKQQAWLHECDCQSDPEKRLSTHGLVHFSSMQGKQETEAAGQCV